ncbi:MAG: hypothetical protein C5B50_10550 [Verrucomicrobia bacterium]|nr:MAG: hypothetical protein C5B50_10550 [Verrucomicrobiota bacterium]
MKLKQTLTALGITVGLANITYAQPEGNGLRSFQPDALITTAAAFSEAIKKPAVMLDSANIRILAPKPLTNAAAVVLPYLERAYDELYKIVGVHTKYKILIYAWPEGTPGVRGGTSGCVIKYTDENLYLINQSEWTQYHVPHVSGYIEEMAHNFVHATGAEFGWEMLGWSLSTKVCQRIASNPIYLQSLSDTQRGQDQTWQSYINNGQSFPPNLPADQVDRIHAYLLRKAEQDYGTNFWSDFFSAVRKQQAAFVASEAQGDSGPALNLRYRLTVECLNQLPGLNFKKRLEQSAVSTTVAIQSLKPTQPGWNRKLQ